MGLLVDFKNQIQKISVLSCYYFKIFLAAMHTSSCGMQQRVFERRILALNRSCGDMKNWRVKGMNLALPGIRGLPDQFCLDLQNKQQ